MSVIAKVAAGLCVGGTALLLGACAALPASAGSAVPAGATSSPTATVDPAEALQRSRDLDACAGFGSAIVAFSAATKGASAETYAAALTSFAYEAGRQQVRAAVGSPTQLALAQAAQAAAAATDVYKASGEIPTSQWLAVQTSIGTVTDVCDLPPVTFAP